MVIQADQKQTSSNVKEAWQHRLKSEGYEPPAYSFSLKIKHRFLSRMWRRILKHTGFSFSDSLNVLEFGCGGGAKLVPLFANGWNCIGVDCSEEVLHRARQYVQDTEKHLLRSRKQSIEFICEDFLKYENERAFDLVFQVGVLEHYINDDERLQYLKKMFDLAKPGGFIVSVVPNGEHVFRAWQRIKGLGGYEIPEIDYTMEMIQDEMVRCGAFNVHVLTHDLLGYRKIQSMGLQKLLDLALYAIFQIPIFQSLPHSHSAGAIAIG